MRTVSWGSGADFEGAVGAAGCDTSLGCGMFDALEIGLIILSLRCIYRHFRACQRLTTNELFVIAFEGNE
jgi:hypothetical protein